jgi:carboxylesterase
MAAPVKPGSEAWSHEGGPHGALVIHGFTGDPSSMRPLAEAFAAAGFSVELPRLPGHGTAIEDMLDTTWDDWSGEAEAAYQRLAARTEKVVVAGLSMGGALTAWLASRHPELAGIVCINAIVTPLGDDMVGLIQSMVDSGESVMAGIGSDIAKPDVTESSYGGTPLRPLLSMIEATRTIEARLADITCPVLVMTSPQDHVVSPTNSDVLAERVSGPVERVVLERSYHVATLDWDAELIEREAVAFARRVTGAA